MDYRPVAQLEDGQTPAAAPPPRTSRLQWVVLFALSLTAGVVLAKRVSHRVSEATRAAPLHDGNSTALGAPRRRKRAPGYFAMGIGRMGTSSSFVLRSRRRSIKLQVAKAATRRVILIGSHFGLGNELLKRVFGELCQKARLSLRCEAEWGGVHDLKALATTKGKKRKRLVWLENDAVSLRRTLRGLRTHASDFRLVHLVWDPLHACAAQWPLTLSPAGNVSFSTLCHSLRMEQLSSLYKRAKRDKMHALQLRLEDLVGRKAPWRQLFKFLELPEKEHDLSTLGSRAVTELDLRGRVLNSASPGWVGGAVATNATLMLTLRRLRRELDYHDKSSAGSTGPG